MFERLFGTRKAEEVLESINGITLTGQDIAQFGDTVGDHSPIHREEAIAKSYGFNSTPVIGVHLAAIGGRISRDLLSVMRGQGEPIYFTGQQISFRSPVYPGEPINWKIEKAEEGDKNRTYTLVIPSETGQGKPKVELISEFTTERPIPERHDEHGLVYQENREITPKIVTRFYQGLREPPKEYVPFSLGVAITPSTLLSFLEKLNAENGTNIGGKNLGMISRAYEDLSIGDARIDVYLVEKSGRGNRVSYTFDGVLSQEGRPIIESRIKTLVNGELPLAN